MTLIEGSNIQEHNCQADFQDFARRYASGRIYIHPTLLPGEQRRIYIRDTLREDHEARIQNKPEEASHKFDKLATSLFKFFRGTALLYYRDQAGCDAGMPVVFTIGDVHPENFGVMPNENNAPFFGVNDFDEAYFAPFTYDVKRGATGFYIATVENKFSKKHAKKVVRCFVNGYLEGLQSFAKDDRERWHQFRLDNSPGMIKELIKEAKTARGTFLKEKIDIEKERFRNSDEVVPYSKYLKDFQKVINTYVKDNALEVNRAKKDFFEIKDVAIKKNSGTASLGLDRYWILINGPTDQKDDSIILEMKQARTSALIGLVGKTKQDEGDTDKADRIVNAHNVHLVGGDRFYGYAKYANKSYLIRERSPFKHEMDLEDLDKKGMTKYAEICGQTLAQTHARSDEDAGVPNHKAENQILESINPKLFVDDIVRFARASFKRIKQDYHFFKKDHKLGAFDFRK